MNTRDRLRTETKDIHQSLDDTVGAMKPFSSVIRYRYYLSAMDQLYCIYGEDLDHAADSAGLIRSVDSHRSAIRSDADGRLIESVFVELSPLINDTDVEKSKSKQWAIAYVLEGSAMGARYMAKVAKAFAAKSDEKIGTSYLEKLAADSHKRWPTFVKALNEAQCDDDFAVEVASSVFATAAAIFNGYLGQLNSDLQ